VCVCVLGRIERVDKEWLSPMTPAAKKTLSTTSGDDDDDVDNDDGESRCECPCQTTDEDQLSSDRLDDIAFDNHIMQTVYRKVKKS